MSPKKDWRLILKTRRLNNVAHELDRSPPKYLFTLMIRLPFWAELASAADIPAFILFFSFSFLQKSLSESYMNNCTKDVNKLHILDIITNFCLFWKTSLVVINKIKNPPNCLLSKNPPKSFKAGADHSRNPACSPLILPQLSQQMVQPLPKTHSVFLS